MAGHSENNLTAVSERLREKAEVVEVTNRKKKEGEAYLERRHGEARGLGGSSVDMPTENGAIYELVEDYKAKKGENTTAGIRDGKSQTIDENVGRGDRLQDDNSFSKYGITRYNTNGFQLQGNEMAQNISETATYLFPLELNMRRLDHKLPKTSCLLDADCSDMFVTLFPDVDWKEDPWLVQGLDPVNESLGWYGHNDLPTQKIRRLQQAVVISAVTYETKSSHLTWNGFAKPFLSLFGRKLRQFLLFVQGDGEGLAPVNHEHEGALTVFDGRHATILCWLAVDIAYGSKITFRDYLKKLCDEETIPYCDICEETGYHKHLLFSFYRAASLVCPYMTANDFIGDVSTKTLLDTCISDYITISRLFETNAVYFHRVADTTIQPSASDTFQHQELSLPSILKSTDLQIVWCENLNDHLFLGQKDGRNFLSLYWPCHTGMLFSQLTRISDLITNYLWVKAELLETCAILFTSSDDLQDDVKYYGKLEVPEWMRHIRHGNTLRRLSTWLRLCLKGRLFRRRLLIEDFFSEIGSGCEDLDVAAHFGKGNGAFRRYSSGRPSTRFEDYKVFGDRLRILKTYMDLQQPKGIRQLWRDTRNKKDWYTFWAVIIIGGIGLIFAAASFAVSAAQTAATFQALQLQLNQPSQTSSTP